MKKTTILLIFLFALCVNAQNNVFPQKMYEQTPNRIEMLYNVNSFDLFSSGKYKALQFVFYVFNVKCF